MARDYILAGATGLVGSEILRQLAQQPGTGRIICLGRSAPQTTAPNLIFIRHGFSGPIDWSGHKPEHAVAICTLGTTIKKAGSQEAFRQVDFDFVLNFAEESDRAGATSLHVVTAHGSSARSGIFYNRVKGEIEEKLQSLNLKSLHIYRPSLLLGDRAEERPGEAAAAVAAKLLGPVFKLPGLNAIQPTPAPQLASYILQVAEGAAPGNNVHSNAWIMNMTIA
jgi:uncharacterized protein YbjT (DUF2867 family)